MARSKRATTRVSGEFDVSLRVVLFSSSGNKLRSFLSKKRLNLAGYTMCTEECWCGCVIACVCLGDRRKWSVLGRRVFFLVPSREEGANKREKERCSCNHTRSGIRVRLGVDVEWNCTRGCAPCYQKGVIFECSYGLLWPFPWLFLQRHFSHVYAYRKYM